MRWGFKFKPISALDLMVDVRHFTLAAITAIVLLGTLYSVVHDTYLDTSNPLLSHLPHKLSNTHYFATKSNPLNVYFIKKSWGWTTLAFFASFITAPSQVRTKQRVFKFLTLTVIWLLFTSWFFGPALLERITVFSGGQCIFPLPSGDLITIPDQFCHTRSTLTPHTHPDLFTSLQMKAFAPPEGFRIVPRIRNGHDISGHIFILTMSTLFLADQLRPSFRAGRWSSLHGWAIAANIVLIWIWLFACYTTSVYFHAPFEKFTGLGTFPCFPCLHLTGGWLIVLSLSLALGVASFVITQLPFLNA